MPISTRDAVAIRLDAIMQELELETVQALADLVGAQRSAASNWVQGYVYPPVHYMCTLKDKSGIPLDWIYAGDPSSLPMALGIRLQSRVAGLSPTAPAPKAEPRPARKQAVKVVAKSPLKKTLARTK